MWPLGDHSGQYGIGSAVRAARGSCDFQQRGYIVRQVGEEIGGDVSVRPFSPHLAPCNAGLAKVSDGRRVCVIRHKADRLPPPLRKSQAAKSPPPTGDGFASKRYPR